MRHESPGDRAPESETLLGSAASRALAAERRRLGLGEEPADRIELWGRRIGRGLAWIGVLCLLAALATTWGPAAP